MTNTFVIGLDLGTTSVKAVLFDLNGRVITEFETGYPLTYPYPIWAEQDPAEIEQAAVQTIGMVMKRSAIHPDQLIGIGMSAAMHSLVCVDHKGAPLSPLITWADGRSTRQAETLKNSTKGLDVYLRTGTPIHPMSPLNKLIWMKENDYAPYTSASYFLSMKEFLLKNWFGETIIDYPIASATGLFDLHQMDWDADALELAGISTAQLSQPVPPETIVTGLPEAIAEQMGINTDTPFVLAGSDGLLANLGIGAINPGEVAITIGTSGAIRQFTSQPETDALQETFCYAFSKGRYIVGGPINNGGIVLKWVKELFDEKEMTFEALTALADSAPAGAEGLLFHPYLNGERAPIWNADARGNFFGVSAIHRKKHFIRAAMEGVIFSIYEVGSALNRLTGPPEKIYASGGFARSPVWLQMLADIFNQEVHVPVSHQSSAWGAAWMVLYATGRVETLESIKNSIPMKESFTPNPDHHQNYMELYHLYKELGNSLAEHYAAISSYQKRVSK